MAAGRVSTYGQAMVRSARVLLESSLDYAGTFPPAGLPLAEAVGAYARALGGPHGWMLGRFVVSATSLQEIPPLVADAQRPAPAWELSVVLGTDAPDQLDPILRAIDEGIAGARMASLEFPPLSPEQIRNARAPVPASMECFFEVPVEARLERSLEEIARAGGHAKIRTGGVTAAAFPRPEALAGFMTSCASAGLEFKATAGLHHAVRGCYGLTYDAGSGTAPMYGFLNVAVAAALVRTGAQSTDVAAALVEPSADAFGFDEAGVRWNDHFIAHDTLAESRRRFFRSFGSCSFDEPIEELKALHLL